MHDCIFCKITIGEISVHKIYEDETIFAFLDKHPINPGHIIVIPKKHEADFYNLDSENYHNLWSAVKILAKSVNKKFSPKKVGLIVAGWDVSHAHVHIVPMNDYHDITSKSLLEGKRANPTEEELSAIEKFLTT